MLANGVLTLKCYACGVYVFFLPDSLLKSCETSFCSFAISAFKALVLVFLLLLLVLPLPLDADFVAFGAACVLLFCVVVFNVL